MDQIERLFSGITPGTITIIREQISTYRNEFVDRDDLSDQEKQELAWCDRVIEVANQMITDKS